MSREELQREDGEMDIKKIAKAFEKNNYQVSYFETAAAAADYLDREINQTTVAFGDSQTLLSMDLYEKLSAHNMVYDPEHGEDFFKAAKDGMQAEFYVTSVNGATEDGILINLDGTGNRVAGTLYGHRKVYLVFGTNKIEPDLEKALWRVRNVAAPKNALRKGLKTPCAYHGGDKCYDCSSSDRICNALMIHFKKMRHEEMEVVLINEALGF